jgi:Fe-S cluster biosynthesis and repair protein YggX
MSTAARRAVSQGMKAYWAKRKAVKIKGSVKTKGD